MQMHAKREEVWQGLCRRTSLRLAGFCQSARLIWRCRMSSWNLAAMECTEPYWLKSRSSLAGILGKGRGRSDCQPGHSTC